MQKGKGGLCVDIGMHATPLGKATPPKTQKVGGVGGVGGREHEAPSGDAGVVYRVETTTGVEGRGGVGIG